MENLNHTFRVIWNQSLQVWQAVAETACSRGKTKSSKSARRSAAAAAAVAASVLGLGAAHAGDLPTGAQVVGGQAQVQTQGRVMTVQQSSDKLALDWQSFNVGQGHTVNFVQPSAQSVALNRVLGSDVSLIQGAINANGKLFLVNPNGILFTPTARVDVGSLVASTLNISPADFMAGKFQFEGDSSNAVENQGQIRAASGGAVALIAARIVNTGEIRATGGNIVMGAGRKVRLDLGGTVQLDVQEGTLNAMIEQGGALKAADGRVYLSARSARDLVSSVINHTGLIEANSLTGTGGLVVLEADKINLGAASKIDTTGAQGGGKVLVGGDWQGSGALRQASQVSMASGALIDASATQNGDGGKVVLWSDIHRADSVTDVRGTVLAQGGAEGGNGGQVETSGHLLKVDGSVVRAGAAKGLGGEWLLDPYNVTISSAADSNVNPLTGNNETTYTPPGTSNINVSTINAALSGGTSVTINTGASGSDVGDITVNSGITSTSATDVRFRLQAANSIVVNQDIAATGNGKLNVELDADNDNGVRNGGGIVILSANISTKGGSVTVGGDVLDGLNGGDMFVDGGANAITMSTLGGAVNIKGQLMVASSHASGFSINSDGGNVAVGGSIDSGNSYSLVNQSVTWLAAAQAAKNGSNGGAAIGDSYLISVTSRLENSIGVYRANGSGAWIGAYRDPNSSSWFWVGGPEAGGTYAVNGATPITPVSGANGTSFFTQATGLTATGKYENFRKNTDGSYAEPNGTGPTGENAGQFVGALGLWNDLVRTDASVHAPGYVRETNAAPSTVNINAGAGSVSIGGSVGASKDIAQLNITAAGLTAGSIKTSTGFSLTNSGAVNLGSPISGTGTLTKSGAGTLTLIGSNTYSGATTVSQGTLQIGAGGTTGTLGTGAVTNNSTLTFDRSNAVVVSNTISGTGNLVKEGAGSLTLSGDNTYSGETTVSEGSLQIGAGGTTGTLGTGAVTNNGTLIFDRSDATVVVNTISGTGNLVKNGPGTMSLMGANTFSAGLTLSAGALGLYHNTAAGSGVVSLANGTTLRLGRGVTQLANDLVLTGNVTVDLDTSVEYLVVGGGGGGGAHAGGGGGGGGVLAGTIDLLAGTNFSVVVGAGGVGAYSVGTPGHDNYTFGTDGASSSISSTSLNITALGGGRGATYRSEAGGGANVSSGGGGTGAYSAGTGTVGQGFAGSAGFSSPPYTAGGGGGAGGAAGPASQTNNTDAGARGGAGGVGLASSIAGESSYYGGGGGGAVHGTAFNFSGALGGLGGLGGGGNGTPLTTSVINPVELTANSGVANTGGGGGGSGGGLNLIRSYGGAGGSGIVMVRYLGSSAGVGGTVTSGTGAATGYTLHSFTSTGSSNLTLNANAMAPVLSGVISGTGSLTADASGGSIALTGANTYTNTTISGGKLKVGNNTSTGRLGSGTVTNNAALVIDRSNDFEMDKAISGTGSLTKLRASVTTLTGDNSYSGTTTISEGTLQVGDGGTSGSLGTGAVTNNGTLKFNRSNAAVAGNFISGTGDLVKEGAGTLTLTANSTYTGTNTINDGTLVLQNDAPNPSNKAFGGTGALRIESSGNSFSNLFTTTGWNFGSTLSSLTLGKAGNMADVTVNSATTVAGPISIYGGTVSVESNLTSTADGDIVLKGITDIGSGVIIDQGVTITKTAGEGTLLAQSDSRVKAAGSNLTASGSGKLNVVLWSDYNGNDTGGIMSPATITTNGGHVWIGGSNSVNGSATWNGLTVGNGPSMGAVGANWNALDWMGTNITTAGGDVLVWGGTGYDGGWAGITVYSASAINTGSGNITLIADQILGINGSPITLTTTGHLTLAPDGGAYASALDWQHNNALSGSLNIGGIYDYLAVNNFANLSGFTMGSYTGMSGVTVSNSSNVTLSDALQVAGPIDIYGGNVVINAALTATGSNMIRLTSSGTVTDGASGAIVADKLGILGGNVTLDSALNNVGTLAASGVSGLTYVNNGALTIGTVNPVGIRATGPVSITTRTGDLTLSESIETSNTTSSAITLNAGAAAAAGTAAGGNIVVTGTPSLTTGTGGRATLYTGDISDSSSLLSLTGLASGSGRFRYNSDEASNGYTAALGTGLFAVYREQPVVGLTGGNQSIIYGQAAPALNGATVNGDTGDIGVQGSVMSGAGFLRAGTYNVGSAALTALGYGGGGILEVTRKATSISGITASSKVYDGSTAVSLEATGATGWISGDDVTVQVTGQFDNKNVGSAKVVNLTSVLAGSDVDNYTITNQANTTASITARQINAVLVNSPTKTYDGNTTATLNNANFQLSNVVSGEGFTVTQTSGTFNSQNVLAADTVTSQLVAADFAAANGTSAANYALPTVARGAGVINVRPLTVFANDQKKTAGEIDPVLSYVLQNLVQGDALNGQVVRAAGESVGEYSIDPSSLRNSNYQVTYVNGALSITPLLQSGPLSSLMPNPLSLTAAMPPEQNLFTYNNMLPTQVGGMVLIPIKAGQLETTVDGTGSSSYAGVKDTVQSARAMGFSGVLVLNGGVSLPAQAQPQ